MFLQVSTFDMTASLDDFFYQIIHSERRAEERKNHLNEVKSEIQACVCNLKDAEEENETHRGQLVLKVQQLMEEELEREWLASRHEIFSSKKQELETRKKQTNAEVIFVDEEIRMERQAFCQNVCEFVTNYDLINSNRNKSGTRMKENMKQLQDQENALQNELQRYNDCQFIVQELGSTKDKAIKALQDLKNQERALYLKLKDDTRKINELEFERQTVSRAPQTDAEFKRIQTDLEAARSSSVESDCNSLLQDLQQLQKEHWQKQLQAQRRPPKTHHQHEDSCQIVKKRMVDHDALLNDFFSNDMASDIGVGKTKVSNRSVRDNMHPYNKRHNSISSQHSQENKGD